MPADPISVGDLTVETGGELHGSGAALITDVVHDSRLAREGSLFAAIRGFEHDGHSFVAAAAANAATAALVEELVDVQLPQIVVPSSRAAMAPAAAAVHGHPSKDLQLVGITGTNGKTTVAYMVESIAAAAGKTVGRIGTLGATVDGRAVDLVRTTPESSDLQRLLRHMADAGVEVAVMEVSSHALSLHRADALSFAVAAFTNLSQDHLDFHADMGEYFAAKQRLFDGRARRHVIWMPDSASDALVGKSPAADLRAGLADGDDVWADDPRPGMVSSTFVLHVGGETRRVTVRPGGAHNIANGVVAAACAHALGIDLDSIASGLAATPSIPGRLEPVEAGQPFTVVVDYAHTPGAVETVVRAALEVCSGDVIAVVGSAGDRDQAKRPLMGAAAALAPVAIITSDNPRSEDPQLLVDAVLAGTGESAGEVIGEVDRTAAIFRALDRAQPGDVVLILGKGHEQGQDFGDTVVPYDDRTVARDYLAQRWAS